MREWQVGDPAGDGNDIGVPDTRYMDYLKEDDDGADEKVEDFRFYFRQFYGGYRAMNYDLAFDFLKGAFEIYQELDSYQKKQLSDNPFSHMYVAELCTTIYNRFDERQNDTMEIIERHNIPIVICDNCQNIYPKNYKSCVNCQKSFEKSGDEKTREKIAEALQPIVYDKSAIGELVSRSMILMDSNDSRLVKIEEIDFLNIHFIFEKEHEYFKTTYRCLFCQENHALRIFEDFEVSHDHTRLLQNSSFQKSISKTEYETGFKFRECDGGYGARLDKNRFDFIFTDEIYVTARFDMGNGHTAAYDVDLDNLKLSKDYRKY